MGPRALLIAIAAVAWAGCSAKSGGRTPCAPGAASKVEYRDANGQLLLALKATPDPGTYDLCNAAGKRSGRVEWEPTAVTYKDEAGVLVLKVTAESKVDATGVSAKGPRLRIHVDGTESRVLKPDGVPFGSVVPMPKPAEGATIYDPASRPVGRTEPRDKDMAIRAADGATRGYVVPSSSSAAAAAFALDGLSPEERATLYLFWNK